MSGEAPQEDRTEAATPRRLQRAREEGQVAISRELVTFAGLAAVTLVMVMAAPAVIHDLAVRLSAMLSRGYQLREPAALRLAGAALLYAAAPFVLAASIGGVAAVLLQTRFLLSAKALRADLSRISPQAGLRRLLGPDNLMEAGKSLAKVALVGIVLWRVILADLPALLHAPFTDPKQLLAGAAAPVLHVILVVLVAQGAIAGLDFFWVTLRHSRKRMLAAVPKATVVITNPTHYAVALTYKREKQAAPKVVAKGLDSLAARIREVAEANHVPLVANPPLAHALYRVEVDSEIPAEHYQAVAEIIAYVWRLGRAPGR